MVVDVVMLSDTITIGKSLCFVCEKSLFFCTDYLIIWMENLCSNIENTLRSFLFVNKSLHISQGCEEAFFISIASQKFDSLGFIILKVAASIATTDYTATILLIR